MLTERYQKSLENFLLKQELRKMKKKKKKRRIISVDGICKTKKKRRVGRPKKRGPKKKRVRRKKIIVIKERPVFDFKIITSLNGKQNGYIGQYREYCDAFKKMKQLEECNNSVVFPRKFLNSGTINIVKDEYLILEKNRFGDKNDVLLRNEFGKFVKHKITNNDKWVIRDKIVRLVEESFWVYGYDPKTERKTCSWIYDNLIINSIESSYDIIRVMVYKNKLIIKYDNKPMSIVMCKNKSDSIRLYNFISEKTRDCKIKQVVCIGAFNVVCDARREIEKDMIELTGWSKTKIQRSTN